MRRTLTDAAPAARFAPWGTIDGHVLLRQLVDVFDKGEQAPVPLLAGFNSGEIRSLRVLAPPPPANAAEYESTIRDRYLDLADEFLRLYPSTNMQESIFATTRDALYGWTAQRLVRKQTALGQPVFPLLLRSRLPGRRRRRSARLPRQRIALCVRHVRSHAAALAESSGNAAGDEALRRDDRLLELALPAPAVRRPPMSRIGRRSDRRAPTWHSRKLHTVGSSLAGDVRVQRGGRLPAPSERGHRLELECRLIFAQTPGSAGAM